MTAEREAHDDGEHPQAPEAPAETASRSAASTRGGPVPSGATAATTTPLRTQTRDEPAPQASESRKTSGTTSTASKTKKRAGAAGDVFFDDEALGRAYDWRLLRRILGYVRPYRGLFALTIAITVGLAVIEVILPVFLKDFLDGPFRLYLDAAGGAAALSEADAALRQFIGLFATFLIAATLVRFLHTLLTNTIGQRVIYDLRTQLFAHLQGLGLRYFERNPVGRLVTRVTSDVESLAETFTSGLVQLAADLLRIVAILVVMFAVDVELSLVVAASTPFVVLLTWVFRSRARAAFRSMRRRLAALNAYLQESIGGMRIVQLFCQEDKAARWLDERNAAHKEAAVETVFNFAIFMPMVQLFSSIAIGVLLYVGGQRLLVQTGAVSAEPFTVGRFMLFYFWTRLLFQPILELSERYNVLQSAMASSERIFRILDHEPEITAPFGAPATQPLKGGITFEHVWFSYTAGPKLERVRLGAEPAWVLEDISFSAQPGEHLAIVGATGGGKTTITNLIGRFYDAQRGRILLDDTPILDYDPKVLRRDLGVVLQDVFLFAGTIEENIRLGNTEITRERVREVAELLQAAPFIERLPKGYDQPVHERGLSLSTGQRQLIAFARALAFDPRILILDEATANIDTESEQLIQQALTTLLAGRTAVIVAHRLSTIKACDQILVVHKGRLRERGTHEELLGLGGIYTRLYELQYREQANH